MKHPVDASFPVSQPFGVQDPTYTALGYLGHQGIDYATPIGTDVFAADDGNLLYAIPGDPSAGNFIHLTNHTGGLQTRYLHLSEISINLIVRGQPVAKGQLIGRTGNTGVSTGPHLHFEVIDLSQPTNGYKGRVNPEPYFSEETTNMQSIKDSLDIAWAKLSAIQQKAGPGEITDLAEEVKQQCVVEIKVATGLQ